MGNELERARERDLEREFDENSGVDLGLRLLSQSLFCPTERPQRNVQDISVQEFRRQRTLVFKLKESERYSDVPHILLKRRCEKQHVRHDRSKR